MSDLPSRVQINEEGPREGFQIEPGPISTKRKIELIDALSQTGLSHIQIASFVNPKRVPGWADADAVVAGIRRAPGVHYSALWLNEQGLERALAAADLYMRGSLSTSASEAFMKRNANRDYTRNLDVQRNQVRLYKQHDVHVSRIGVMAAFGCNYEGEIGLDKVRHAVQQMLDLAQELDLSVSVLSLADTMGWATPGAIKRVVGAMREHWPSLRIALHLHDTRGQGIVNAYAGLQLGVDIFDASVAGLGGCPFAALKGAAGNVCTEDLVFMCEEMGIDTGVDLDSLIEAARLAEDIVGHPLPGAIMRGGSLGELRRATQA